MTKNDCCRRVPNVNNAIGKKTLFLHQYCSGLYIVYIHLCSSAAESSPVVSWVP